MKTTNKQPHYTLLYCAAMLVLSLTGCNSKGTVGNTDSKDSITTDSAVSKIAATPEPPSASEEESDAEDATSADVAFFDLHGPVRVFSIVSDDTEKKYTFDEKGTCTSFKEPYIKVKGVRRDARGRIIRIDRRDEIGRGWADQYSYDSEGRVKKASCHAEPDGLSYDHNYHYSNGRITCIKGWNDGVGGFEIQYEYVSEDGYGNWTIRKKSFYADDEDEPIVTTERRFMQYY